MVAERLVRRVLLAVRRSRFMPASSVDRVTEVPALPRAATVMVYFPTSPRTLYQLRAWYPALRTLHDAHRLVVVCRDSRTAGAVRTESGLDAVSVGTLAELDDLLEAVPVALALYPNLDVLDFDALAATHVVHVYIGHGDSAKAVFSSHQVAAFDRYFVATPESALRVGEQLMFFDPAQRCIVIGEPQGEIHAWDVPAATSPRTVLYAPTWEGATSHDAHSSLLAHGRAVVETVLAEPDLTVVYRPHPLTGSHDPRFAAADAGVRRLVEAGGGRVDTGPDLVEAFRGASALVADVSAVTSQWQPSGRPCTVLRPGEDVDAPALVADLRARWADSSPLSVDPTSATTRFVQACTDLMAERDRLRAGRAASPGRPDESA